MSELVGRHAERAVLDDLLAAVRAGESRALVLRGEEGIGKTALLDHLAGRAAGCRVVRAAAVPSEAGLEFAGLHQVCAPLLDRLDGLPLPQREAVGVAFGLRAGAAPDRLLVGLGVLGLLGEHFRSQPTVCVVDDVQWLDPASAQVLGLAARRVRAESLAVVFASRVARDELDGLPVLPLGGVSDDEARELLALSGLLGPLDERAVAECHGNPLALLELARAWPEAGSRLESGWPTESWLPRRIEDMARRESAGLDAIGRLLLLAAAIEPNGDPAVVARAAERLGAGSEAAVVAGAAEWLGAGNEMAVAPAGLVEFGDRVLFRHPLLRAAVCRGAGPAERRRVHAALAEVIDPDVDPVGHVWQRAQAAVAEDDDLAEALAGCDGGPLFLQRAAELTTDPGKRGEWLLAAAELRHFAGTPWAARHLLALAEGGPLDELGHARAEVLRAQGDAGLLRKAAAGIAPLDSRRARRAYVDALRAAGPTSWDIAEAPDDPLLHALTVQRTAGLPAAAALLRAALPELDDGDPRELWAGGSAALELGDDTAADALTARAVRLAAGSGPAGMLPDLLGQRIVSRVYAGALPEAGVLARQLAAVCRRIGVAAPVRPARLLAAWAGREVTAGDDARAVLLNGLARHEEAYAAASGRAWPVLVERLVAAAQLGRAEPRALQHLQEQARAAGSEALLGLAALCRGMLGGREDGYREAVERLERTTMRGYLGRAHLYYGEWLWRAERRRDARGRLRTAYEMMRERGILAFADLAGARLGVAGRKRPEPGLTSQETQIVRLARDGLSNVEIAARLFLSPRTVEWHLSKVFTKLGISSRRQLRLTASRGRELDIYAGERIAVSRR
ncbi:AAA family ATPase [Actinoplanes sp. NPDC051343]|uniref:AAA family ATPase n=1 Tax=Actinoplanes sp. NPDC051343 TaxID=3363906 RepID=UPI0037B8D9B2